MIEVPQIPFNLFLGITRNETLQPPFLQIEEVPHLHNHIGTMHACAQFALAEAASGECLLLTFRDCAAVIPYVAVLRGAQTKYRAPANGRLHATARLRGIDVPQALDRYSRKGKVLIAVAVDVLDDQDVVTMTATFTWYVRKAELVTQA